MFGSSMLRNGLRLSAEFGLDPLKFMRNFRAVPSFVRDLKRYRGSQDHQFQLKWRNLYPVLSDKRAQSGTAQGHYFHQDLWVAQRIFEVNPTRHIDIGSRVDGFIAHLLVFREVEVVDIRPAPNALLPGLKFTQDDATELSTFCDDSLESISTLHAPEHFGLGRYGDPVDPSAWRKFVSSLKRVLAPGGNLYFSIPCGVERLEFNAHRIFDPGTIIEAFSGLTLVSLHGVKDDGNFYQDIPPKELAAQRYGCGIFRFTK